MSNKTGSTQKKAMATTDRVIKFSNGGVNKVIAFTPVHLGATRLQLVPKNKINITHVWTSSCEGQCRQMSPQSLLEIKQSKKIYCGRQDQMLDSDV